MGTASFDTVLLPRSSLFLSREPGAQQFGPEEQLPGAAMLQSAHPKPSSADSSNGPDAFCALYVTDT